MYLRNDEKCVHYEKIVVHGCICRQHSNKFTLYTENKIVNKLEYIPGYMINEMAQKKMNVFVNST